MLVWFLIEKTKEPLTMKRIILPAVFLLIISFTLSGQEYPDQLFTTVGRSHTIDSKTLGAPRKIFIHLPAFYEPDRAYPLVVTLDARMTFKSFASVTELMGIQQLIEPCIVVSITSNDRQLDYAPLIAGIPESGRADRMIDFFEKELFPYLRSQYRISEKLLWGHSWLGVFSTYVMLSRPDTFDGYIASSPSYRFIADYLSSPDLFSKVAGKDCKFYFSFGSEEKIDEFASTFEERLKVDAPADLKWKFKIYDGKNHDSNGIMTYMDGLEFFFSKE